MLLSLNLLFGNLFHQVYCCLSGQLDNNGVTDQMLSVSTNSFRMKCTVDTDTWNVCQLQMVSYITQQFGQTLAHKWQTLTACVVRGTHSGHLATILHCYMSTSLHAVT